MAKKRKPYNTRPVVCNGVIYDSVAECARTYGVNAKTMNDWLLGKRGAPQEFVDFELKFIDGETRLRVAKKASGSMNCNARMVECLNTGEVFGTLTEACAKYNVNINSMVSVCKGRRKTAGMLPNGERLRWRYYQEE